MMKKLLALLLSVFLVVGMLTACDTQKPQETESVPTQTKPAGSTEPPATAEPVKDYSDVDFSILWWGGDQRHLQTIELIEEFEKMYPGLRVNVDYVGMGDYATKIQTYAAGNDLPDVIQLSYLMIPDYARNGILHPLDSYINDGSIDLSKADLTVNSANVVDGQTYAIATGANALCLIYNPALLKEAGVEISMAPTMSEYVNVSKAVYEKTGAKADIPYADFYFLSKGESTFAQEGNEVGFTAETYAEYCEIVMTGIEEGYFISPSDPRTGDVPADLAQGTLWCSVHYTNEVEWIENGSGLDVELCSLVIADDASNLNPTYLQPTMAWGIAETSVNKELATAFINFFVNNQVVYEIAGADRGVPISSDMKAYIAQNASPALVKALDFLNYLAEGHTSPMKAYTPANSSAAESVQSAFGEEMKYLTFPKEELLERVEDLINRMNEALVE